MATVSPTTTADWTVADVLDRFGPIPLRRIRQDPPPGAATEQDVLDIHDREDRLYELVDGTLVEKTMGVQESYLAVLIATVLTRFVEEHDLGFVLGADGMPRPSPGLVRIPDVSFIAWRQLPTPRVPNTPFLNLAPEFAVEVLSPSDTAKEMDRKLRDYFDAGVRLVWYIDPASRTAQAFTAVDQHRDLTEDDVLTGDDVLPGFELRLRELFARLES